MLDISKAKLRLGWEPVMGIDRTISMTTEWYKKYRSMDVHKICLNQIAQYAIEHHYLHKSKN